MSLQLAAKHLATKGRGPDTELVHMTKGEVQSLQHLAKAHGGSLTINPHTGLAEAGFLSSLLPMAIGAGAMYFSGGAINPATIGAITGGLQYARTGSLAQGLTAGLGAYGGAGLATGITPEMLTTKGGETAANSATQMAEADVLAQSGAPEMASNAGMGSAAPNTGGVTRAPDIGMDFEQLPVSQQPAYGSEQFGGAEFQPRPGVTPDTYGKNFYQTADIGKTATSLKPEMGIGDTLAKNATFGNISAAASPVLSDAMTPQRPTYATPGSSDLGLRYAYNPGTYSPTPSASDSGEQTYMAPSYTRISPAESKALYGFASGGDVQGNPNMQQVDTYEPVVRMADGGMYDGVIADLVSQMEGSGAFAPKYTYDPSSQIYTQTNPTVLFGSPTQTSDGVAQAAPQKLSYSPDSQTYTKMARGGLSDLGGYSDGGRLLRGPGDGVSDSIPAMIGKKQPARLADGEFVVPARIVSELGNGSTEAGARQLYKMMDRVQKARGKTTGKKQVAKNTRAANYLPA